jgi:hypothetical protein
MTDSPRRKKPGRLAGRRKKPVRVRKKGPAAEKAPPAAGIHQPATTELDLRTLVRLSLGDWSELADLEWPPDNIRRWLERASIRQVRGLLLTTLHRWHELRRDQTL